MHSTSLLALSDLGSNGALLLSTCPGLSGYLEGNTDNHNVAEAELRHIKHTGVTAVLSLVQVHELQMLGMRDLPKLIKRCGLIHFWFPIEDRNVPKPDEFDALTDLLKAVMQRLTNGETIMIHCHAGLGRSGTFAALVLIETGLSSKEAMQHVRQIRPGAIESSLQEDFLRNWSGSKR